MKIDKRKKKGVTILGPKGRITIGVGDVALRLAVQDALDAGELSILLNLADVTTVDASGIAELVGGYIAVSRQGGELKLLHLPPKVADTLQINQLITIFDVFDDEGEAVDSFA